MRLILVTDSGSEGFRFHPGICVDPVLLPVLFDFTFFPYIHNTYNIYIAREQSRQVASYNGLIEMHSVKLIASYKYRLHRYN